MTVSFDQDRASDTVIALDDISTGLGEVHADLAAFHGYGVDAIVAVANASIDEAVHLAGSLTTYIRQRSRAVAAADRLGHLPLGTADGLGELAAEVFERMQADLADADLQEWIADHGALAHHFDDDRERSSEFNAIVIEGMNPEDQKNWWSQLSDRERLQLIDDRPDLAVFLISNGADVRFGELDRLRTGPTCPSDSYDLSGMLGADVPVYEGVDVTFESGLKVNIVENCDGIATVTLSRPGGIGVELDPQQLKSNDSLTAEAGLELTSVVSVAFEFESLEAAIDAAERFGRASVQSTVETVGSAAKIGGRIFAGVDLDRLVDPVTGWAGDHLQGEPVSDVVDELADHITIVEGGIGGNINGKLGVNPTGPSAPSDLQMFMNKASASVRLSTTIVRSDHVQNNDDDHTRIELVIDGTAGALIGGKLVPPSFDGQSAKITASSKVVFKLFDDGREQIEFHTSYGYTVGRFRPEDSTKIAVTIEIDEESKAAARKAIEAIIDGKAPHEALANFADKADIKVSKPQTTSISKEAAIGPVKAIGSVTHTRTDEIIHKPSGGLPYSGDDVRDLLPPIPSGTEPVAPIRP